MDKAIQASIPSARQAPVAPATAQAPGHDLTAQSSHRASNITTLLRDIAAHEASPIAPSHVTGDVLAFALDTIGTPLLIVDRSLHIHFANSAAEAGLSSSAVLGRSGRQLTAKSPAARSL
jgi:hypothetical protein